MFAFEWQLRYHNKHCGTQFKCSVCEKIYIKPMSLVMHCKRNSHPLPSGTYKKHFKLRKNNIQTSHSYIFVPIFVEKKIIEKEPFSLVSSNIDSIIKNKPILPKSKLLFSSDLTKLQFDFNSSTNNKLQKKKNFFNDYKREFENKRSTDCQTVRKRSRLLPNFELKSTQTQTLHSSFDANKTEIYVKHGPFHKKCSSFTQTLIDDIEPSDFIVKDAFLSNEVNQLEQAAQTEFSADMDSFQLENYSTSETQTNTNIADLGNQDVPIEVNNESFKFADLEFIDIETQTIWNNDRTTQTENDQSLENWIDWNL